MLFDRADPAAPARPLPERAPAVPGPPTEQEYRQLISGFWLYATRVAKFTRRGDLWRAMYNLVNELNLRVLTLLEWQARATGSRDTWYGGRFLADWADPHALAALPGLFAHYDAADLQRALREAVALFRQLAQHTAAHLGYDYPAEMDLRVSASL